MAVLRALLAGMVLVGMTTAPVRADYTAEWQRLNPYASAGAEHERLTCQERDEAWTCIYDKVPDPGFAWDRTVGRFTGVDTTASWVCPGWFPAEACTGVVQVLSGNGQFRPDGSRPFVQPIQYIVTEVEGSQRLQVYWADRFVCPWYRTFDEALAANPDRTGDCTFA